MTENPIVIHIAIIIHIKHSSLTHISFSILFCIRKQGQDDLNFSIFKHNYYTIFLYKLKTIYYFFPPKYSITQYISHIVELLFTCKHTL